MDIVFAHTEYKYDSYFDFRELVRLAGFETCFVKDIDLERNAVYVTSPMNGELRPHVTYRRSILKGPKRCQIISWNLERFDSGPYNLNNIGAGVANSVTDVLQFVDRMWVSDRYFASLDPRLVFVPLGSDARLASGPPEAQKAYDVAHLSYVNGRRDAIYGLVGQGRRMAPNAWGAERDRILRSSRCMLYVHQTPAPIQAPLRFALAAAYRIPLIAETMADPHPLQAGRDFLMAHYNELVPKTVHWLSEPWLKDVGESLHKTLCVDLTFRKSVEEGIVRTFS